MADQDDDQEPPIKDRTTKTLAEKIRPIQDRAWREGFVFDSDDKKFMDEAWGEDSDDPKAGAAERHRIKRIRG